MTLTLLLKSLICVPAVAYMVEVIINSQILVHLVSRYTEDQLYTREDLKNWLMQYAPAWVFDLLHCPLCLSFHCAWILAILMRKDFDSFSTFVIQVLAVSWAASHTAKVPTGIDPDSNTIYEQVLGKTYKGTEVGGKKVWEPVTEPADPLLAFFDTPGFCKDPYCNGLKLAYDKELAGLQARAEADKGVCSPCQLGSLKNKYYIKLKEHLDNAP